MEIFAIHNIYEKRHPYILLIFNMYPQVSGLALSGKSLNVVQALMARNKDYVVTVTVQCHERYFMEVGSIII